MPNWWDVKQPESPDWWRTKQPESPDWWRRAGAIADGPNTSNPIVAVPTPEGFSWTPPFTVTKTGSDYSTDYDPADKLPSGWDSYTTYYVDHAASGGSGTEGDPYDSLYTALHNRSANILVYAKPGVYSGNQAWRGAVAGTFGGTAYDVIVRPWPGESGNIVSDMGQAGLVWTLESGNVWKATTSGVSNVRVTDASNPDAYGLDQRYTVQNSIVNCEANPGSAYFSSNTVYVHTHDSREPDADVTVYSASTTNGRYTGAGICWLENMTFLGGNFAFHADRSTSTAHKLYTANCIFRYSGQAAGGVQMTAGSECIHYQSISDSHENDGFKYVNTIARACNYAEIGCSGRSNGVNAVTNAANGSSAHDGARGIRVGGHYANSRGRALHDIAGANGNAESWILGTRAGPSSSQASVGQRAAFACGTGASDASQMWLDGAISESTDADLDVADLSTIRLRDFTRLAGAGNDEGTGTITTY